MNIFVLEDEIENYPRNQIVSALSPRHTLTIAKSCDEAKSKFTSPKDYQLLLLDHDMEGNYEYRPDYPNTGLQFVKWLAREGHLDGPFPEVIVHSYNSVGAKAMRLLFSDYGVKCVEFKFGPAYVAALKIT